MVTRDEARSGVQPRDQRSNRHAHDFLLGLVPLKGSAVLIIDEAQNCRCRCSKIRILSNLETDKEKLLQIILVGQLNPGAAARAELRQLDQRVSIRYQPNR